MTGIDESIANSETSGIRQLNMGMIGIGVGGARVLGSMSTMPTINLVAGADTNSESRTQFHEQYGDARVYSSALELCEDPEVEAVWISTPNRFHAEHVKVAAEHGKHIVVEKPMAVSLADAEQMLKAVEVNGVKLLAGHTWSFNIPIRVIRRIVNSGKLGALRAVNILSYTDWMLRPRTEGEIDIGEGGGVPYRQGPHQVDTVRLLGGGMLRSIRAMTGEWMPERPGPGYYAAYMEFENGVPATIIHNGYGYFIGAELVPWGESRQEYGLEERVAVRQGIVSGSRDEAVAKQGRRDKTITADKQASESQGRRPWIPGDLGLMIVSCERGDIRQSKWGLTVYDDDGIQELDVPLGGSHGINELDELYNGIFLDKPIVHDGAWGFATLEATLSIMESAKRRQEVYLSYQVPLDESYDAELSVPYLDD